MIILDLLSLGGLPGIDGVDDRHHEFSMRNGQGLVFIFVISLQK